MEKERAISMIRAYSDAYGAPGFEDAVLDTIRRYSSDLGEMEEDKLRNLYLDRNGNTGGRPVVQLDAHTDEVSFIVQAIKPNGTIKFLPLGGWVTAGVAAHRVLVRNALGEYIPGIIATTPPHYMTQAQRDAPPSLDMMTIDVGASSKEEAERDYHIRIGEPVVPDVKAQYDEAHDLLIGKAFDCRYGCAAITGTLDALRGKELAVDVVGAFAVQEEVGLRGAAVTAKRVNPDVAICFEGCPADDTVVEPYMVQTALKKGPMLRFVDARMITHPRFQRFALDLGEQLGIPVQGGVRSGGSTNGGVIHLSNLGVPCIVIGLPVRYIHTHYGIAAYQDYENAVRLGTAVLEALNEDVLRGF
ncbi:peptidase M42 [Clostridia bacterium]|nr:peptidase M42 [Clostridia bacterium]